MIELIEIKPDAPAEVNFQELHDKVFVDVKKPLQRPPIALSLGTYEYKGNYYPIPFGSYGDFSCLVGASKSMKTFLKSALIAGYIGGRSNYYFPKLLGHNNTEKFVLDIDTEQSIFHTQKVAQRVCEMVGSDPDFYRPFTLREQDPKIRFQFIEWLMLESEYRSNIGFVAVDGAADILETVNDLDVSNKIVQGMMKWTSVSKAHLCTVLHKNPGSEKPTGHLGSAILKKAETVAFVTRQDYTVKVTPEYTRNIPFEEFSFALNDDHLPEVVNDF